MNIMETPEDLFGQQGMLVRSIFISICLLFVASPNRLLGAKIPNLKGQLKKAVSYQEKAQICEELAWQYKTLDQDSLLKYARNSMRYSKLSSDNITKGSANNRLGDYYLNKKRYDSAVFFFSNSFRLRSKFDSAGPQGESARNTGLAALRCGLLDTAEVYLNKAIRLFEKTQNTKRRISCQTFMASVFLEKGDFVESSKLLNSTIKELNSIEYDSLEKAHAYYELAIYFKEARQWDDAREYCRIADSLYYKIGHSTYIVSAKMLLASIDASTLHFKKAHQSYNWIEAYMDRHPTSGNKLHLYTNKAHLYYHQGYVDSAGNSLKNARKTIGRSSLVPMHHLLYLQLGNYYYFKDENDSAEHYYVKSLDLSKTSGNSEMVMAYYNLSTIYAKTGRFELSRDMLWHHQRLKDTLFISRAQATAQLHREELKREKKLAQEKLKARTLIYTLITAGILIAMLVSIIAFQREKNKRLIALKDQKLIEQEIESLLKKQELKSIVNVLEIQEKERRRIAQDLHDRLGGMIATMKLLFYDVQEHMKEVESKFYGTYEKALGILDEAGDEVRRVSHNLISGALKNFGLEAALRELADTIQQSESIEFRFICHGLEDRLDTGQESHLYRIVQEMVSNTLKHAEATEITLQLLRDNGRLNVIYEDNGIGFDPNSVANGIGLKGISSRVDSLEGTFNIDSGKGVGSTYNITISLKKKEND